MIGRSADSSYTDLPETSAVGAKNEPVLPLLHSYHAENEIVAHDDKGNELPRLPAEVWTHIVEQMAPDVCSQADFSKVCQGAHAIGCEYVEPDAASKLSTDSDQSVKASISKAAQELHHPISSSRATFYNKYIVHYRQTFVNTLFDFAVRQGNLDTVEAMIMANPNLLLEKYKITDYASGHYLTDGGVLVNSSDRQVEGTLFECVLRLGDIDMCEVIEKGFERLPDGKAEMAAQIKRVFPEGIKSQKTFDFSEIVRAIDNASYEELFYIREYGLRENAISQEVKKFRNAFTMHSLGEKVYNPWHLLKAIQMLRKKVGKDWHPVSVNAEIFHIYVIGYVERFLPVGFQQALALGLPLRNRMEMSSVNKTKSDGSRRNDSAIFGTANNGKYFSFFDMYKDKEVRSKLGSEFSIAWGGMYVRTVIIFHGGDTYLKEMERDWTAYIKQQSQAYKGLMQRAKPSKNFSAVFRRR